MVGGCSDSLSLQEADARTLSAGRADQRPGEVAMDSRSRASLRRMTALVVVIGVLLLLQETPASACRSGIIRTPAGFGAFVIGQATASESYRGIHGSISIVPGTQTPDLAHSNGYHINVTISNQQANSIHSGGAILAQIGWQMGMLQLLPSGVNTWADTPTIFFEGLDNVGDYRATFGAATSPGDYEVSWGGASPTGRNKYIGWYQIGGTWYQAGFAELDNANSDSNSVGEASDTTNAGDTCIQLTPSTSTYHEHGSPSPLLLLTDVWHDWSSAFPALGAVDNGNPYKYYNLSAPNFDHDGVGGP